MPTIEPRIKRRYSVAEQLFIAHQDALLGYITVRLPVTTWHVAEDLARETWISALDSRRVDTIDGPSGLPDWLARQARVVVRRYLSPVADGNQVRVDKGPAALPRATAEKRLPLPTPAAVFGRPAALAAAA